jgi:hypothetical protein
MLDFRANPDGTPHLKMSAGGRSMAMRFRTAFFAYPAEPSDLRTAIEAATKSLSLSDPIKITAWPQLQIFGANIPDKIREGLVDSDILICDVTRPNLNVYYEIGFAIGRGKILAPVINTSFANATRGIQRDGFFDNIGYRTYENSEQLLKIFKEVPGTILLDLYAKSANLSQPLFVLDTFRKTDFRNAIISAVKASRIFYRSFDPVETPRFSTLSVIAEVTASGGVIVPFLSPHIDDADRHNLRAALTAGLSHGLGRQTLLLQREHPDQIVAADYRDFVHTVRNEGEINDLVGPLAASAIVESQSIETPSPRAQRTDLQRLSLGASAAENEFRTLQEYFVQTAEFGRTLRGEVRVVAGRKGSGKTAIFFQVRDTFRRQRNCLIVDLKPESHQLSLFREELLKVIDIGVFDHTLAAFWYFLILSEMLLALKRDMEVRGKYDSRVLSIGLEIDACIQKFRINESGDFTARINNLGNTLINELKRLKEEGGSFSPQRLTNLIFEGGITHIRTIIEKHTKTETQLIFLFDNIDKGWPANGVPKVDARMVRLLIETLDKVKRDFDSHGREFQFVVFLRNDIYEILVEETPDRGKAAETRIDWTDRAKIRQVIYRRLQASIKDKDRSFGQLWGLFFVENVQGRESFEYFVDHCLMRPRFLINVIDYAIANAINRGNQRVEEDDCLDAVRQHALYLIDDFGYEIRDVSGIDAGVLYSFVGVTQLLTKEEILDAFQKSQLAGDQWEQALWLMLWYGVLGITTSNGEERFIYDYDYNMKRLEAEIRNVGNEMLYIVNAGLHVGLVN